MNCINLVKKVGTGEVWCKLHKRKITNECKICELKEYAKKEHKKLKQQTAKQRRTENKRFSIFTGDLTRCIICGQHGVNKHEIFFGSGKRPLSKKYGLVIPLCRKYHHNTVEALGIHFDTKLCGEWQKKGQKMAMKHYGWSTEKFIRIFGRSYK
jgi:hypothetical protein